MIMPDNTDKLCFISCSDEIKKQGRCSCHNRIHAKIKIPEFMPRVSEELLKAIRTKENENK